MIRKILIANRGEIVNRIIDACRKSGIEPVILYSGFDTGLDYLDTPVEKHLLKGSTLAATYLNGDQIIEIAKKSGADAIHPGYGFLSENADFARQCVDNGITWIGPSPEVMRRMAGKESSRRLALEAGVPVLEAVSGTPAELKQLAHSFRYPLLAKAVSGGGGRGMRIIRHPLEFQDQVELASAEAGMYFSDNRVFVEQYLEKAKHIEVQVIGDKHGNLVHLFERECTVQRRYQKIIEESPSPSLTDGQRAKILEDAVRLAVLAGYDSAGTLEFLADSDGNHYFMEMNTRIQVEHPVTEMVTGIDLVDWQIRVAAGLPLAFRQEDVVTSGHAIECRICAEDPAAGFKPHPGTVSLFRQPVQEGIRTDHAIGRNFTVSPMFDSLIAKVIVHDSGRQQSLEKMVAALTEMILHGVPTTREYLREAIRHPEFINGRFDTGFVKDHSAAIISRIERTKDEPPASVFASAYDVLTNGEVSVAGYPSDKTPWSTIGHWRILEGKLLEYEGKIIRIEPDRPSEKLNGTMDCSTSLDGAAWISLDGNTYRITDPAVTRKPGNHPEADPGDRSHAEGLKRTDEKAVYAPLPGMLSRLLVKEGDRVMKGDVVAVIESMKTENQLLAVTAGTIGKITASAGQQVKLNELILQINNN
jgi:3-methylcrotonyl-CoA carboxylase alpha subunit